MNQCAEISLRVRMLHSRVTTLFYSGISVPTFLALLTSPPQKERDSSCFVSVNRLPHQVCLCDVLARAWSRRSCGVCVCKWYGHVFNAACVECACAVNKGAAERWLSPHDLQAPRILHFM